MTRGNGVSTFGSFSLKKTASIIRRGLTLPVLPMLGVPGSSESAGHTNPQIAWGYWGPSAPNHWGELSSDCELCSTGTRQSPIEINDYDEDVSAPPLVFNYGREPASIDHNGIVAHVEYGNGDALTVGGRSYGLVSMHVHVHAEHQVDRELFPAEMHLVHSTNEGLLAVVGQIYRLGAADPTIQALIDAYPQPGSTAQSPHNLNSAGFLPSDLGYYHYEGSLTTPPGTEGVAWYVLREPKTISQEQVNRIASLHNGFNHRPIQSRNGRSIVHTGPRRAE